MIDCISFEGHYRVPSLYPKRSNQALWPGPDPLLSPCRINTKSKHQTSLSFRPYGPYSNKHYIWSIGLNHERLSLSLSLRVSLGRSLSSRAGLMFIGRRGQYFWHTRTAELEGCRGQYTCGTHAPLSATLRHGLSPIGFSPSTTLRRHRVPPYM